MSRTVYLAGPIHGRTDLECKQWRQSAAAALRQAGHKVIDPMSRDYRGNEEEHADELVAQDKEDIEACDTVLVNANEPSWGTAMEVLYAISFGKDVIAFSDASSISPWLRCHTTGIFATLKDSVSAIVSGSCKGMR